jgi:hypothetical protein
VSEISMKTAELLWASHNEVRKAEELLEVMRTTGDINSQTTPEDAFGRRYRNYEFGIPSGGNGHRLVGVTPKMARYVIESHIAECKRALAEACVIARMELDGVIPAAEQTSWKGEVTHE